MKSNSGTIRTRCFREFCHENMLHPLILDHVWEHHFVNRAKHSSIRGFLYSVGDESYMTARDLQTESMMNSGVEAPAVTPTVWNLRRTSAFKSSAVST